MKVNIGISQKNTSAVAGILHVILADEFVLYTKTLNAHWNVEGHDFHAMHLFFESQYNELQEKNDSIAERIRSIGHYAPATLKQILELTRLSEQSRSKNDAPGFIKELLADHESIIIHLREKIEEIDGKLGDAGTADFLTSLIEFHEKTAWMLRAHLV